MSIDRAAVMNDSSPIMYHGNRGFGGPRMYMVGPVDRRQYHTEAGVGARNGSTGQGFQRRWQPRRDQQNKDTAFGYESDDSSLSSNASGSNKSGENDGAGGSGEGSSRGGSQRHSTREWRGRRKDTRPQRRIAPDRFIAASYPIQIKYAPDDLLNGSKYDTLSQEIWDKFVKSQQTEETFRKKMNLWRYLYITIRSIFPRYGLYVVGSTMSGFGLESSDMDLCLHVRAPPLHQIDARGHALLHLDYLLTYIRTIDPDAELIQAKVPILKFRESRNGVQVDLNCNNVVGIRNTNLLHCFSTMDWRVRPLVCACKLWARAHRINEARHRTLSSYALTLMVIHFLQCGTSPAILPRGVECCMERGIEQDAVRTVHLVRSADNNTSLGELFLNMLRYYADFPYETMAVSVRAGTRIPVAQCRAARAHNNDPHQWKLLCVEEPFDLTNTARSVYDPETFEKIIKTFRDSYKRLSTGLRLADAWPQR